MAMLPRRYRALGVLHHHVAIRADTLAMKRRLRQTSLTPPEFTFASDQTISD
jgi:hypothetical protein